MIRKGLRSDIKWSPIYGNEGRVKDYVMQRGPMTQEGKQDRIARQASTLSLDVERGKRVQELKALAFGEAG